MQSVFSKGCKLASSGKLLYASCRRKSSQVNNLRISARENAKPPSLFGKVPDRGGLTVTYK